MYKFTTTVFTTSMVGGTIFYLMGKIKDRENQYNNTYVSVNPIVHAVPGFVLGVYTGIVLYSFSKITIPTLITNYIGINDFSSILAKK